MTFYENEKKKGMLQNRPGDLERIIDDTSALTQAKHLLRAPLGFEGRDYLLNEFAYVQHPDGPTW